MELNPDKVLRRGNDCGLSVHTIGERQTAAASPAAVFLYSIVGTDGMQGLTRPELAVQRAVLGCRMWGVHDVEVALWTGCIIWTLQPKFRSHLPSRTITAPLTPQHCHVQQHTPHQCATHVSASSQSKINVKDNDIMAGLCSGAGSGGSLPWQYGLLGWGQQQE